MERKGGKKRWKRFDIWSELMAIEIKLDALHQRATKDGGVVVTEKELSKMLGGVRSIQNKVGQCQKTLKRWSKPAPNQLANIR